MIIAHLSSDVQVEHSRWAHGVIMGMRVCDPHFWHRQMISRLRLALIASSKCAKGWLLCTHGGPISSTAPSILEHSACVSSFQIRIQLVPASHADVCQPNKAFVSKKKASLAKVLRPKISVSDPLYQQQSNIITADDADRCGIRYSFTRCTVTALKPSQNLSFTCPVPKPFCLDFKKAAS